VLPLLTAPLASGHTIDVSLNVFYSNPTNVNSGGTWELVAKSSDSGIAGLSLLLTNITTAQNEGPRGTVNGTDPAGFGQFFNTFNPLGFRNVTIGQVPLPPSTIGSGEEQSVFYRIGTLTNGAPNYPTKPPGTNSIGPAFTSLTNVLDVPWATGDTFADPAWSTAAKLASGSFAAGLTPGFASGGGGLANTGNVFTTIGTSTTYGSIAEAEINTFVRTNFTGLLSADYNDNGLIDAADYVLWRNTSGQTGAGLAADGNGDGTVDQADYDLWRTNFGATAGAGAGLTASAASAPSATVPEPSNCVVLSTTIALLLRRKRRVDSAPRLCCSARR
jgi:hypothetical protein